MVNTREGGRKEEKREVGKRERKTGFKLEIRGRGEGQKDLGREGERKKDEKIIKTVIRAQHPMQRVDGYIVHKY